MASTNFQLEYEDILRLQEAIMNYGDGAEEVINDYLTQQANKMFTDSITNLIPVSDRNKPHAKDNKPLKGQLIDNLTLKIGTISKYHYLYFPQTATGSHFEGKAPNDFMEKGLNSEYDNVVNGMLEALQNHLKL